MAQSTLYWLKAAYRKDEPATIAQDETSAEAMQRSIRDLAKRWNRRFDTMAERLAQYFATSVEKRSSAALRKILRDGGMAIEFQMTPAMKDALDATVKANVALIKSIPVQYFTQVEGSVMRSVQVGRDVGGLAKDIETHYGVTKRRAAFIALDQNNKATAAMTRARMIESGITEAVWVHSGGGKEPRPTHLKAGRERQRYDPAKGWFDPAVGKLIHPGELPRCRCVAGAVVKGFS